VDPNHATKWCEVVHISGNTNILKELILVSLIFGVGRARQVFVLDQRLLRIA